MNALDNVASAAAQHQEARALVLHGIALPSRLLLGTAQYPSPQVLSEAVKASGAGVVTVSLRRESARGQAGQRFFELIRQLGVRVLPNTAGCRTPREAITTAHMAREVFDTNWVKLEVIGNDDTLQPDVFGLVEAADALVKDGFAVFPYTTEDLSTAERLVAAGCQVLMPWGAPIGTGRGLANPYALKLMRNYFPGVPLIIDAGIGAPSHAAQAMEMGYDAVLLNTAVAKAADPVRMARAFAAAIEAGRTAYGAGLMEARDMAAPSTPVAGTPFFDLGPPAGLQPDAFYPIVPDVEWLKRLVPLGLRTVQLRLKDASPDETSRQIAESLEICARHGCQLIVNDYWREAIEAGAGFVHLGQEDLAAADVAVIKDKGVKLGVSTHSPEELDTALAARPDYVALGPIYETKLKVMKWAPQGLARIGEWKSRVGSLPLVAIGGITPERAQGVIEAGASSVAVITDFLTHSDPEARVRTWLAWAQGVRAHARS